MLNANVPIYVYKNPIHSFDVMQPFDYDYHNNGNKGQRLDKDDAQLVMAIHTDSSYIGVKERIGHIDFYVGEQIRKLGDNQAGCKDGNKKIFRPSALFSRCNHRRSRELFAVPLFYRRFNSKRKCLTNLVCDDSISLTECKVPVGCAYTQYSAPEGQWKNAEVKKYIEEIYTFSRSSCPVSINSVPFGYPITRQDLPSGYGIMGSTMAMGLVLALPYKQCYECMSDLDCTHLTPMPGHGDGFWKCNVVTHRCIHPTRCSRDDHCKAMRLTSCNYNTEFCQ